MNDGETHALRRAGLAVSVQRLIRWMVGTVLAEGGSEAVAAATWLEVVEELPWRRAAAIGRRFVRVALAGAKDPAAIHGVARSTPNAAPGRIVDALRRLGPCPAAQAAIR